MTAINFHAAATVLPCLSGSSVNNTVHTSGVYASRGTNPMSNTADGIFADSLASELVTPTGSAGSGYAAGFQIAVGL